jgi:hypothetical protein
MASMAEELNGHADQLAQVREVLDYLKPIKLPKTANFLKGLFVPFQESWLTLFSKIYSVAGHHFLVRQS